MPATEQPLGAIPSSRSVSRLRRHGKHDTNNDSDSRTSSAGDDSTDPADMKKSSMDAAIDKVRERARKSVDERRGSDDSASQTRFSALITRKLKRKEKDKDKDSLSARNSTLVVDSGESGELALSDARSDGSLLDEDGHSSLLTDDGSDNEGRPIRPTISPHQSHAAFLTLSSPQLQAQSTQQQSSPDLSQATTDDRSQALSFNDSTSSLPQIIEPPNTTSPISKSANKRNRNASPSPGDKLRAGFARNRRKSTESARSGVGGDSGVLGGIGGLFKPRSRRSSVTSTDATTKEPQELPLAQASPDEPVSVDQPAVETVAAPETPRSAEAQPIEASEEQKQTPKSAPRRGRINTATSLPETPPGRPETPTTLVTPPTPTDPSTSTFPRFSIPGTKQSSPKALSSVDSIRHRRAQSQTIPSKLSNAIHPPLTPTIEETKTPGGTLTQPTTATGFFSSVFNVAQKAADQLSTTINTGQKKGAGVKATEGGEEGGIPGTDSTDNNTDTSRQPPLATLGRGNISLASLSESRGVPAMNSQTDLSRQQDESNGSIQTSKMEEDAAARAVSVAYEKPVAAAVSQAMGARPLSVASQDRLTLNGDQTPPRSTADADGVKRSSSVRSKISGRRRRHRENSTATTNTNATAVNSIAAALKDSASGFSSVANTGPGHRATGFAVASSKRNKDFHQLFRSVPEDDYLIEDYSAALQKEILLHGRLYVSEGHICFSSNIFGWVTNLVISFDEVVSVEKKNTAVVFPNAIVIQTLHARNTFASFVARDSTYELLIGIWKINHPKLKSSLNGVPLDNVGESDKTEKAGSIASDDDSDEGSEDEVYDEDEDDDDFGSYTEADAGRSIAGSDVGEPMLSRKTSAQPLASAAQLNGNVSRTLDAAEAAAVGAPPGGDFPGPHAHAPTECTDTAEHYDRPLTDTTIPAPLGKVYSLMFGAGSGTFMKKWLVDEQKSRELDLNDDKIGLDNDHKSFTFSYIKPLNGPVGPKQTKCITTNTLEAFDLEKAITVNCSTQTPDVPSGSVFTTKTKYCLMWGPGNSTRIIANCTIEWTGKSWLKGPIEGGAQGGQTQYVKDITAALTAAVSTKAVAKGGPAGRKGKRKGKKEALDSSDASEQRVTAVAVKESNWGLFEPLRGPLDPFVSLLRPFFTSEVVIAVLFTLLMYNWFFAARSPGASSGGMSYGGSGERAVAYEELWRREESELWDWLEDRVGMDGLYAPKIDDRQKVLSAREMGRRLESESMRGREVDDAIRITEERLEALKAAVEREKGNESK